MVASRFERPQPDWLRVENVTVGGERRTVTHLVWRMTNLSGANYYLRATLSSACRYKPGNIRNSASDLQCHFLAVKQLNEFRRERYSARALAKPLPPRRHTRESS